MNSAAIREARQATLELLGSEFIVKPLYGGTSWDVTVHNDRGAWHHETRAVRWQAVEAALDWATEDDRGEARLTMPCERELRDTLPAPAMEAAE